MNHARSTTGAPGSHSRVRPAIRAGARLAALALTRPPEALDVVRGRLELARGEPADTALRAEADPQWERTLHELLGAPWPCSDVALFTNVWRDVAVPPRDSTVQYDGDPTLARACWCAVRHLQPQIVVETGVARGLTSAVILSALERNASGHLWSIDLPPLLNPWRSEVGIAIPPALAHRWTLLRGSSRRLLPPLLQDLGTIDLFVHDSLHTSANVRFECVVSWRLLRAGGLAIVDDAANSFGFRAVRDQVAASRALVARQDGGKEGVIGIMGKPPGE